MSVIIDTVRQNVQVLDTYASVVLSEVNELALVQDARVRRELDPKTLAYIDGVQTVFAQCYTALDPIRKESKNHYSQKDKNSAYGFGSEDELARVVKMAGASIGKTYVAPAKASQEHPEMGTFQKLVEITSLYALMVLYLYATGVLLNNTLPLLDDLSYYDNVLNSRLYTLLYSLQTLPGRAVQFGKFLYNDVVVKNIEVGARTAVPEPPQGIPEQLRPLYTQLYKWLKFTMQSVYSSSKSLISTNVFFNELSSRTDFTSLGIASKRSNLLTNNIFFTILGAPFVAARKEAVSKREKLVRLREANARRLGVLLNELISIKPLRTSDGSTPQDTSIVLSESQLFDTAATALSKITFEMGEERTDLDDPWAILHTAVDLMQNQLPELEQHIESIRRVNGQPRSLVRYWPSILIVVLYAPSLVTNTISQWDEIVDFVKHNVVGTVVGFWQNWIVSPLNNILATVRHDDQSRIAIMSKQSLEADLSSLERMVTDYSVANLSLLDQSLDPAMARDIISENVKNGDITIVMKKYEQDLKTPVKSIVLGDMLTNLLIQIQKAKVDGTVAISGIDKILKSQELVFGVVAASPSLLVVYWMLRSFESYIRTGYFYRFSKDRKLAVLQSLNNTERIFNLAEGSDTYESSGMLLLELITLRRNGLFLVPKERRWEFLRDVNDLTNRDFSEKARQVTLTRIWNNYGFYFKD